MDSVTLYGTANYPSSEFWICVLFVAGLGLIWGSFFNVCIARIPDRKSLLTRSACPKCGNKIPWFANIPVLSFIYLKAKCLSCKNPISIQYPLVETATAAIYVALYLRYGFSWQFLSYTILASNLLVISVIDLYLQIIPDELSLPGIVVGFLLVFLTRDILWWESLFGILIGGGSFLLVALLYEKIAKREGLGGGDIKLLAMIGAWLGYKCILPTIIISSALGSIVGVALILFKGRDFKTAIPFGPFLAVGAIGYLFWGKAIDSIVFLGENL